MPKALRPILAAIIGLALGVGITAIAGENPWNVFLVIAKGAFGTPYDFGMTLFYATPLIFTGLAVALPFHAGLFNIGAEGQLTVGAMATAVVGILWPNLSSFPGILVATAAGFAAGAAWGALPGWLKAYRGSHEVISTIMMNFIAAGLTSWVALYLVPSLDTQNPESATVGPSYLLTRFEVFGGAPVTAALIIAVLSAFAVWGLLRFSARGFEIRASGANPEAAEVAGISAKNQQVLTMALAGGIAGLVGLAEVLGNSGRFKLGFSPDYGFIGIPVALLARANPIGAVVSALLFGALQKGTSELDLETTFVTRDLAATIQALVVLAVSVEGGLSLWRRKKPLEGRKEKSA